MASEKGWPAQERERLERLPADEERRRALFDQPRRMEFVGRALMEMLGGRGSTGGTVTPDLDEIEVRVVAQITAEALAPPG